MKAAKSGRAINSTMSKMGIAESNSNWSRGAAGAPCGPVAPREPVAPRKKIGSGAALARFAKAVSLVSILYAINILLGLGRDSILASTFGATEQLDALLLGLNFIRSAGLQIALAVSGVLIPVYAHAMATGDSLRVINLTRRWLRDSLLALVPASLALMFFAGPLAKILGPGLGASGQATLAYTLAGMAPLLLLISCAGLSKALADSYGMFGLHPIFLGLMTLGLMAGVWIAGPQRAVGGGVFGILIGSALGLAAQAIMIGWRSPVEKLRGGMLSLRKIIAAPRDEHLSYASIMLLLGSSLMILLQGLIERAYASHLPSGSIVALSLALSVVGIPTALLLPAVSSILLPRLSRQEHVAGRRKYGLSVGHYSILIGVFAAITIGCWAASDLMVNVLFLRGRFTAEAADLTSATIRWLSISFISYVLGSVFRQVLIARRMIAYDFAISAVALCVEVAALEILVPRYGLKGLVSEVVITASVTAILYLGVIKYVRK